MAMTMVKVRDQRLTVGIAGMPSVPDLARSERDGRRDRHPSIAARRDDQLSIPRKRVDARARGRGGDDERWIGRTL